MKVETPGIKTFLIMLIVISATISFKLISWYLDFNSTWANPGLFCICFFVAIDMLQQLVGTRQKTLIYTNLRVIFVVNLTLI